MRAFCQLVSLISLLNLKNLLCCVANQFWGPVPQTSNEIKTVQTVLQLAAALVAHKRTHKHTRTYTHTGGKKSPPKNYHNQLAHVKQVVPKATDQCVCLCVRVCLCVCNIICTHLMFIVIFSSLFHFEHSFLWQRQFDIKKRKEKCIIIIIETFVHVKHRRVTRHVLCNNFNFNDRKFSGICLFIYGMHISLCIVYSIYGRFNFKDKLGMNEEKGNSCSAFSASVARGIYR